MSKKWKRHNRPRPQPTLTPAAEVLPRLNLGYLNSATVAIPTWNNVHIVLVGAGGIGAYAAQHIGRLMSVLYKSDRGAHLTICDPDVVTDENIGRQLFCSAEVGTPKAVALMRRYGQAWGLNVSAYPAKFERSILLDMELEIIVGCVDGPEGRRAIAECLKENERGEDPRIWWLDCGNLKDTGRVLLGCAASIDDLRYSFSSDRKQVFALPSPAIQSPGLLQHQPEDLPANLSCAQLAAANLQSLNINDAVAIQAADILTRLLITQDLRRFAVDVNLAAGVSRSRYCTVEEIGEITGRRPEFLVSPEVKAAGAA